MLTLAHVVVLLRAGAGLIARAVELALEHNCAGAPGEGEGSAGRGAGVCWPAGDRRVRRVARRKRGLDCLGNLRDPPGAVGGAYRDGKRAAFGIRHVHRRLPETAAKRGVDERAAVHAHFYGGQPHVVARRAVEAQHPALRQPGVRHRQRAGVDGDRRRGRVQREGHREEHCLRGAGPVRRLRRHGVQPFAGDGDAHRALHLRRGFVLRKGQRLRHRTIDADDDFLEQRRRFGRNRDAHRVRAGDDGAIHRRHDDGVRRRRHTGLTGPLADRRCAGLGTAPERVTGAGGCGGRGAGRPQRVGDRQPVADREIGEDRLEFRDNGEGARRFGLTRTGTGEARRVQVAIHRRTEIANRLALLTAGIAIAGAGRGGCHHHARVGRVDHPTPEVGADGDVAEHVGGAQVELVEIFQPGGDRIAPGRHRHAGAALRQVDRRPGPVELRFGLRCRETGRQCSDLLYRREGDLQGVDAGDALCVRDHAADGERLRDHLTRGVAAAQGRLRPAIVQPQHSRDRRRAVADDVGRLHRHRVRAGGVVQPGVKQVAEAPVGAVERGLLRGLRHAHARLLLQLD